MSELIEKSWYTKYRPKTIEEYSGASIRSIVEKRFTCRENMPHVMMIQGNRGCGKTTFARLISKYYLCSNLTEDGPCEECEMCNSINEILIGGESSQVECPGVTELDATIMNGKEAIQSVLDDALQSPIYSDFKVLIVDECHMISTAGQNSMLKIIEDIPPHLIVIFATTNPEKVLQTIKSRCQLTLDVKKQTIKDMSNRLMFIAEQEGLQVSKEALEVIARKGNRVPRECINLLETIAKTYNRKVTIDTVGEYFGGESSELYIEYFEASNKSLSCVLEYVARLRQNDIKIQEFVSGLMQFVIDSMYIKHGIALEDYTTEYIKIVKALFDTYKSNEFDMLLQILDYLSHNVAVEDNAKNEVLLVLTAMRISKVGMLAKGLADEQSEAISENKISLIEHSKKLKETNIGALEKLKTDLSIEDTKDSFDNIEVVKDTAGILDGITLPELAPIEEDDDTLSKKSNLGSEVDDFFSED